MGNFVRQMSAFECTYMQPEKGKRTAGASRGRESAQNNLLSLHNSLLYIQIRWCCSLNSLPSGTEPFLNE